MRTYWVSGYRAPQVDPQYYAFRWITLLLTQEFPFPDCVRLWDSLLGDPAGRTDCLLRLCTAMLLHIRDDLLAVRFRPHSQESGYFNGFLYVSSRCADVPLGLEHQSKVVSHVDEGRCTVLRGALCLVARCSAMWTASAALDCVCLRLHEIVTWPCGWVHAVWCTWWMGGLFRRYSVILFRVEGLCCWGFGMGERSLWYIHGLSTWSVLNVIGLGEQSGRYRTLLNVPYMGVGDWSLLYAIGLGDRSCGMDKGCVNGFCCTYWCWMNGVCCTHMASVWLDGLHFAWVSKRVYIARAGCFKNLHDWQKLHLSTSRKEKLAVLQAFKHAEIQACNVIWSCICSLPFTVNERGLEARADGLISSRIWLRVSHCRRALQDPPVCQSYVRKR